MLLFAIVAVAVVAQSCHHDAILTAEERAAYANDGVVLLKRRFDDKWLRLLRDGIEEDLASERRVRHTPENATAHYFEGVWAWSKVGAIEKFCRESPVASLAAELMGANERVNLIMDNWFVREAGSSGRPPWHHDISYFDFAGPMTVLWLPLEDSPAGTGLSFVRSSHLWGKHFQRIGFGTNPGRNMTSSAHSITVAGVTYEPPPIVDDDPTLEVIDYDVAAGDALFFDIRTVHGARRAFTPVGTSRRFSLRLGTEGVRLQYRGDWAAGEREIIEAAGHREGDATDSDFFPALWRSTSHQSSNRHLSGETPHSCIRDDSRLL